MTNRDIDLWLEYANVKVHSPSLKVSISGMYPTSYSVLCCSSNKTRERPQRRQASWEQTVEVLTRYLYINPSPFLWDACSLCPELWVEEVLMLLVAKRGRERRCWHFRPCHTQNSELDCIADWLASGVAADYLVKYIPSSLLSLLLLNSYRSLEISHILCWFLYPFFPSNFIMEDELGFPICPGSPLIAARNTGYCDLRDLLNLQSSWSLRIWGPRVNTRI